MARLRAVAGGNQSNMRLVALLFGLFGILVTGLAVASAYDGRIVLMVLFAVPTGLAMLLWPETALALYVNAGSIKLDPRLRPITSLVDLTLLLAGVLIVAILYRLVLRRENLVWGRETSVAFLFSGLILLATLYTPVQSFGVDKAFRFSFLTMLAYVAPLALVRSFRGVWLFFGMWLALSAVFTFDAIGKLGTGQRLSAFNATNIAMGRVLGVAILILFFAVLTGRTARYLQVLSVLGLGFMFLVLLGTGSRGPLIMLSVTILVMLGVASRQLENKARVLIILGILAGVVLFTFSSGLVPAAAFERYTLLLSNSAADSSAQARLAVMRDAWQLFVTRPFLGWGTGAVSAFGAGREQLYPHNILLELAAETGLVGVSLYLILFAMVFYRLLKKIGSTSHQQPIWMALMAMLLFTLLNAMVSGDLNANRDLFLFSGVAVAAAENSAGSRAPDEQASGWSRRGWLTRGGAVR